MKDGTPGIDRILLIKHHRQPSGHILRTAADLARRFKARLTFADVLEGGDQIAAIFQSVRLHEMESLLSPHLDGVEADYRLIDGDLATATDGVADEFDLVLLADSPRPSEARGHEIRRLLRQSSVPVWLDGGGARTPRRILAAVDVSTRDPLKRSLNLPILERALLIASVYEAELDILSAWTPSSPTLALAHRLAGASDHSSRREGEVRRRLEDLVEQTLRLCPPLKHEPRLLVTGGFPVDSIALTTEAYESDLLIVGCVGREGIAAWLVGDTAEKLSRRLDCSILAVKPGPDVLEEGASQAENRAA